MSYILDALRKSEAERRQAEAPVLSPGQADAVELPRRRVGAWAVVVVGLVVVAGAATYWWYSARSGPERLAAVQSQPVAPTPPATQTAAAKPPALSRPVPEARKPAEAPPELKPHPLAVAPEAPVRDLAGEARVEAPKLKRSPAAVPPRNVNNAPSNATLTVMPDREQVRFLRSMPVDFQRELPELVVNIHIYASRESERILYINNRQYHAGEKVRGDIVVEDIVQDGAVLSYRGQRFKLPRPS